MKTIKSTVLQSSQIKKVEQSKVKGGNSTGNGCGCAFHINVVKPRSRK